MAASFHFEHSIPFSPENSAETLRAIPALPGVFALHGPPPAAGQPPAQPYLTRAARIDFTITGSEFESVLTLYRRVAQI